MSLLIACFCHDLDHRGYTNAFLRETDAPLSALYSSSLLENHHFTQTLALLQIPGLNIFSHLTEQQHKKVCSTDPLLFNVVTVVASFPGTQYFERLGTRLLQWLFAICSLIIKNASGLKEDVLRGK